MAVYLLHFDRPFRHAKHYLGFSKTVESMHRRIDAHYNATAGDGQNHHLIRAAKDAGISFTLARFWPKGTRADERRMKHSRGGGHARRCPICRELRRDAKVAAVGVTHANC